MSPRESKSITQSQKTPDFKIIPAPLLAVLNLLENQIERGLNFLKIPHTEYELSLIVTRISFNSNN